MHAQIFFHQRVNGRRRRNLVAYLKTPNETITWSHEEKEEILFNFYSELLGNRAERGRTMDWDQLQLSTLEDEDMDRPFSEQELEEHTVKMLPAEKAPGPDGFTGTLYKQCWQTIKGDILQARTVSTTSKQDPLSI